jgi:membrane-associated protease RseP (regulator of RpoE activity)
MSLGDKIYTIGNPLGIKYTVTSGIISNMDLEFFQLGKGFMIDAAINPGNSGGPLIDERGQVVGIVFAGILQYEGVNFAIPFQWVRKTIPALYKTGEVKRCWIGAGLYMEKDKVYFYYVLPSGTAFNADIKEGDRLISIDGEKVESVEDAQSKLAWRRYPSLVSIKVERNGKIIENILRLDVRPYLPIEEVFNRDTEANIIKLVFGIGLEYYDKKLFSRKYVTKKIYRGKFGSELKIGMGDSFTVYDLKYIKKDKLIKLTIRYQHEDFGVVERSVSVLSPAEINSII